MAINNQIEPQVILFAKENPEIFQSFTEVENPKDNQYIYHLKVNRAAFVTPRSLETASHIRKMEQTWRRHYNGIAYRLCW